MGKAGWIGRGRVGLLLALACCAVPGAAQAPAETPLQDAGGHAIGDFETWVRRRASAMKVSEPRGWLAQFNGFWKVALLEKVDGQEGSALKGTVRRVPNHGRSVTAAPHLGAGDFSPNDVDHNRASGIPVSARHAHLRGVYRFRPKSGDLFAVAVDMMKDGERIGTGFLETNKRTSGWAPLDVPIDYSSDDVPDHCFVSVFIFGKRVGDRIKPVHAGSYYVLDSLVFTD